jgi:hypothetical protein
MNEFDDNRETETKEGGSYIGVAIILGFAAIILIMAITGFNPHGH